MAADDPLTEQQMSALKRQFSTYDDDHDGRISGTDLRALMESQGVVASPADLAVCAKQIRRGGRDGRDEKVEESSFTFSDFVLVLRLQRKRVDMLRSFGQFDVNGDGFITEEEIRHVMREAGDVLLDEEVKAMIALADRDGDGKVNYDEFVSALWNHY